MSKFDQLCDTYRNSRRSFLAYQKACQDFARELIMGMIEYFEWPENQEITYIVLDDENTELDDRFYALTSAMRLDDQSFWHFGIELTLHEGNGTNPVSFVMSFFIKKAGPNFIVKLGPKGREIKIPESQQTQLGPFYEAIFVQITEFFTKKYYQAIAGQEKTFGFLTLVEKK